MELLYTSSVSLVPRPLPLGTKVTPVCVVQKSDTVLLLCFEGQDEEPSEKSEVPFAKRKKGLILLQMLTFVLHFIVPCTPLPVPVELCPVSALQ